MTLPPADLRTSPAYRALVHEYRRDVAWAIAPALLAMLLIGIAVAAIQFAPEAVHWWVMVLWGLAFGGCLATRPHRVNRFSRKFPWS